MIGLNGDNPFSGECMPTSKDITRIGSTFEDLFEEAPVAYHELDENGLITRVNRAESELLGYPMEAMLGRPIWEFMIGVDRPKSQLSIARKLAGVQPLSPFLREFIRGDHRRISVEIRDCLIHDGTGKAIGVRSTLIDVTDRVQAEAAAAESQRWLSTVLRCLTDGVVAVDSLGMVKFLNPAAEKLTAWTEADAVGKEIEAVLAMDCITSGDIAGMALSDVVQLSLFETWSGSGTLTRRDGRRIAVEITAAPIVTEQDTVFGVVLVVKNAS
jgi:PAS domain S-box-containing protein